MATFTTIADMQIVPEKFSQYVLDRTTEKNTMVNAGIATPDAQVAALINGTPQGGRFIELPMYNALDGEEEVFGEQEIGVGKITTKAARATLLIRQRAWGDTDLATVLGGSDPMNAIVNLIADWRNTREQKIYLSILKGILDPSNGALKAHVNDISGGSGTAAIISDGAALDTKQTLGDNYDILGMVFMHSLTYTYLQKNGMITRQPIFNPAETPVEINTYLGYRVMVDDSMPQASGVFDTYFLGANAFIRQDGMPMGLVGTETDRDKLTATNYLINRWCQIIHPRGLAWDSDGTYTDENNKYPANVDLAKPENWKLVVDAKKVPIACLRHKLA